MPHAIHSDDDVQPIFASLFRFFSFFFSFLSVALRRYRLNARYCHIKYTRSQHINNDIWAMGIDMKKAFVSFGDGGRRGISVVVDSIPVMCCVFYSLGQQHTHIVC